MATTSIQEKPRNSSIELLRLLAMLMIVGCHYVWINRSGKWDIATTSFSFKKVFFEFVYGGGGWVGNFIFFVISVWFLADRKCTLRSDLRRIWIMEREVLFWSITLFLLCLALKHYGYYAGNDNMVIMLTHSLLPLLTNLWWYPTSYAIFLLLLPFLNKGMKSLGRAHHRNLTVILLVLWGLFAFVPHIDLNLYIGVFVFIYWYVLITYYRWYMNEITEGQSFVLIFTGLIIELLYLVGGNVIYAVTHKMVSMQVYIFGKWTLPTMMVGFGLFTLANRREFHSKIINTLAASSFGIYLIHFNKYIVSIWEHYIPRATIYSSQYAIALGGAIVIGLFIACLLIDLIRQFLFHLTIDKHRGAWFDKLYIGAIRTISNHPWRTAAPSKPQAGFAGDDSDLVD
ncbi:acyltransferase [Bifidobacterium pseudolongum]|uniref:acyltransferase family protein n=1 Tax=Bifidobacterium pseudolongum TaxID=1694 RepID=UPI0023F2F5D0|nr:acyltransferase [Bifidobacterium pseudolongum]MCH4853759.1 acyltransferase [Bifidobacterium pseudolongum]